jgi:hypothetical protein
MAILIMGALKPPFAARPSWARPCGPANRATAG